LGGCGQGLRTDLGGDGDEVAEAAALEHIMGGQDRKVGHPLDGGDGREHPCRPAKPRLVGEIRQQQPAGPQDPSRVGEEGRGDKFGGDSARGIRIENDDIRAAGTQLADPGAAVDGSDPDAVATGQRQAFADR